MPAFSRDTHGFRQGTAVPHKVAGCRRLAGKLADTQAASTKPLALYGFLQALRQPSGTHGGSGSQPVKAVLAAVSSGSSAGVSSPHARLLCCMAGNLGSARRGDASKATGMKVLLALTVVPRPGAC
ncbi:hypothetical protein WJX72_000002 [[Myrmecia] bisecta]|uniref:Uncharacterized protein n=1 Tax=[Myrmecia] bisecta TaxID=41462 RepID=A0AAW1Q6U8_9CHLO